MAQYIGAETAYSAHSRKFRPSVFGPGGAYEQGGYTTTRRATPEEMTKAGFTTPSAASEPAAPTLSGEARAAWERAIEQYRPGGGYGEGTEAALKRGGTKAVASGMQGLVSAGLAGTTLAGGLGKKYEEEVAAPTRARVEETRAQAIAQLEAGLAGAEQRGYETAEERALRERLSASQLGMQQNLAGIQAGLSQAQLASRERISSQELAMQEVLAKMKTQGGGGGYGSSYGGTGGSYGSPYGGAGAGGRYDDGESWQDWMGAYTTPETYAYLQGK